LDLIADKLGTQLHASIQVFFNYRPLVQKRFVGTSFLFPGTCQKITRSNKRGGVSIAISPTSEKIFLGAGDGVTPPLKMGM